jgi:hypothetical protein
VILKVETLKHPTILFLATLGELNIESDDSLLLFKNFENFGEKTNLIFAILKNNRHLQPKKKTNKQTNKQSRYPRFQVQRPKREDEKFPFISVLFPNPPFTHPRAPLTDPGC